MKAKNADFELAETKATKAIQEAFYEYRWKRKKLMKHYLL
jgi:hypothetical protein